MLLYPDAEKNHSSPTQTSNLQITAHPIPELVDLVTPGADGADGLDPLLLHTATEHTVTEDAVRWQLVRLITDLTPLLRATRFVLDYVLVVPRDGTAERWTGRRRQPRVPANVTDGELVDGHPMLLDRDGRVYLDLWPLVQAVAPTEGAEPELFLFDGDDHRGAPDRRAIRPRAPRFLRAELDGDARARGDREQAAHARPDPGGRTAVAGSRPVERAAPARRGARGLRALDASHHRRGVARRSRGGVRRGKPASRPAHPVALAPADRGGRDRFAIAAERTTRAQLRGRGRAGRASPCPQARSLRAPEAAGQRSPRGWRALRRGACGVPARRSRRARRHPVDGRGHR